MKKKLLALFLVLVMVLGMFPMSAMAAEYPTAEWYNFRNSANNMGITNALTPKSAVYTQLDSVTVFADYVGTPIIVGGYMYAATGDKTSEENVLRKLDLKTGQTLDTAELAIYFNSNNSNVAPIYIQEKGLIVVPLHEGVVQAFNINDLSTAWVYQDKPTAEITGAKTNSNGLGAQVQTPMLYADGKLYVGFANNSTTKEANLVCLDAATGELQWYYPSIGGFYWTSPLAVGNYIVIGSEAKNGKLLMFNKTYNSKDTAAVPVSSLLLVDGETSLKNQRSALAYDQVSGRVYFTCASGYICSAKVDCEKGELSDLKVFQEPNCTSSTNTPIVYGDYVYYGAGKYGGYYFIAANKTTLETVAKVKLQANPQGSFLLSTAYENDGYLYFYTTYNAKPGGLDLVKVPTKNPSGLTCEVLFDALGYEEYCINSPICRADGTIYYRNDSKAIFALSPTTVEVPTFKTNLSTDLVKYEQNSTAAPLEVEVNAIEGGSLSYQWQSAADKNGAWADITSATAGSYTPQTETKGTTYYRCRVGNTDGVSSVYATSLAAEILVKNLSNNVSMNVAAHTANISSASAIPNVTAGATKSVDGKIINYIENFGGTLKCIAFGVVDEGTFDKSTITLYQGLPVGTKMPGVSSISFSDVYTNRWFKSGFTTPFVASVEVTAEDGNTKAINYIVVDDKPLGKYTIGVSGFTADADTYFKDNTITFTEAGQTVTLTPVTTTIGEGEENKAAWTWESSDTAVASVDENGVVKSVGGGSAVITFTCGQLTASCNVTTIAPANTVNVTISDKNGNFVKGKGGVELYRLPVEVKDSETTPDGVISIYEVFEAVHKQYYEGEITFSADLESNTVNSLWGDYSGAFGYYLNDVYLDGSGTGCGTNGRTFEDKLLNTEVKTGDCLNAYIYQDKQTYTDIYTYFEPAANSAVAGEAKILAVKVCEESMFGKPAVPVGAAVKVTNSKGEEQTALNTTVGENGALTVTFPAAGTYTVEVRSKGTVYVTPSRCVVTVTAAEEEGGGGGSNEEEDTTITVSFSLITHNATWIPAHDITLDEGATVADAFHKVLDRRAGFSYSADPDYVRSITYNGQTLGEFTNGPNSGWKYMINGVAPGVGMLNTPLEDGDELVWYYVTDYTEDTDRDEGGGFGGSDETEENEAEESGGGAGGAGGGSVTIAPEATVSGDEATANVGASDIAGALEEAKKDETVTNVTIAPEVKGEANRVTVEIPKTSVSDVAASGLGLTLETDIADVKLPAKAIEDVSAQNGQKVSVSVEKTKDGAVIVEIAVDGKAMDKVNGGVVINLPTEDTGKVLVIVNEDGTETVVKKSVSGADGVSALIEGSATVKLVDNKKTFNDAEKHWGKSAIEFATSRELFNGVSDTAFDPDGTMTRAMLVTVLYRLEGEPAAMGSNSFEDVADGQWYTEAVTWANELGIVEGDGSGFDPNGEVTREQIAVILHRYAEYLDMSTHHKGDMTQFDDHHETSDWAKESKEWAVGAGLITGKDGNKLDPTGDATRAEVATILERLVGLMME